MLGSMYAPEMEAVGFGVYRVWGLGCRTTNLGQVLFVPKSV